MQDIYEVSEAVQSLVTARKHTCLRVSVQGARMPLGGGPGQRGLRGVLRFQDIIKIFLL